MDNKPLLIPFKSLVLSGAFLCLFFMNNALAFTAPATQKSDSLEHLLRSSAGTGQLLILEQLIPLYLSENPKLALSHSHKALFLAKESRNYRMEANALHHIGNATRYLLSDYAEALDYCSKALKVCMEHHLPNEQISILLTTGEIYQELGNSYKAIENYMQALLLAESLGQIKSSADALNKTGQVYRSIGNEAKAIEYHMKALTLCRQHNYLQGISDCYYWLATTYQNMAQPELALQKHDSALAIRRRISDYPGTGYSQLEMGKIYLQKGDAGKAKAAMEESLQIFQSAGMARGEAMAYNYLGALQLYNKRYEDALTYLKNALAIGELKNDKKVIRDSYENLYTCYSGLKDYEQALYYKDLFVAISDFIYGEESERRMAELQTRFEIAEKEREIETLKKDNELRELAMQKQKHFRDSLITGLILLLIILLLIIYLYRNNRRNTLRLKHTNTTIHQQNQELQELNATKDKFFSIISHDLKGPLNSLTAFSGLLIKHTDALSKEEIQMLAVDFDKSLKNLMSLLENLLEWSRTQTGGMEISPEPLKIRELVEANTELLANMAKNKDIQITTQIPSHLWAFAGRHQMNTVLRNLISNALKFTHKGGWVTITASEWKDAIEVMVQDTGVGVSPEAMEKLFKIEHKHTTPGTASEKGTGLGLMLCKEFIEQNGGNIQVESQVDTGSTFRFTIPKATSLQEAAVLE